MEFYFCSNYCIFNFYSRTSCVNRLIPLRKQKSRLFDANNKSVTRNIWNDSKYKKKKMQVVEGKVEAGIPAHWQMPTLLQNRNSHWPHCNRSTSTKQLDPVPMSPGKNITQRNSWPSLWTRWKRMIANMNVLRSICAHVDYSHLADCFHNGNSAR